MSTPFIITMNSLWSSRPSTEAEASTSKPTEELDQAAIADIGPEHAEQPNPQPVRPILQRESSAPPPVPPPSSQPPPIPVANALQQPSDSLSLAQLRRIVADFPRSEAIAYDFAYEDKGPVDEEVDEWFNYQFWQWVRLGASHRAFDLQWEHDFGATTSWDDVDEESKKKFVSEAVAGLSSADAKERLSCLGRLVYIALGRWMDTAAGAGHPAGGRDRKARSAATPAQLAAMKAGAKLIGDAEGVAPIWDALRRAFDPFWCVQDPNE